MPTEETTESKEGGLTDGASEGSRQDDLHNNPEYVKLLSDNKKGHEALQKLQRELTETRESLAAFGDLTPEKVRELERVAQDAAAQKAGADPEQFNALLEERVAAVHADLGSKLEQRDKTIESLQAEIHEFRVTSKVMNEFGTGVNEDVREDVAAAVAQLVRIDESGAFYVVDENGQTRYSPTKASQRMTPAELFAELEQRKPSWFKPKGIHKGSKQTGAVVPGADSGAQSVDLERFKTDPEYRKTIPGDQKIKFYKELGF